MNMSRVLNFLNTVRYLKPRQLFFQVLHRLKRERIELADIKDLSLKFEDPVTGYVPRWTGGHTDLQNNVVEFLCIQKNLTEKINWNDYSQGGLWLDHLHYFRYFDCLYGDATDIGIGLRIIESWKSDREKCSKAFFPPYNASERAFCIGRWLLGNLDRFDAKERDKIASIIAQDIDFTSKNLEWHLDGNHLLKNLAAIWWGTKLFSGPTADKWQKILDRHLQATLDEQILPDGMHYEKSPVYHQIALIDFLDILKITPVTDPDHSLLHKLVRDMTSALELCVHPDGSVCLFNDSPANLSSATAEVLSFAHSLIGHVASVHSLENAGYYRLSTGDFTIIADFGDMGPDEQMGHAHSDMLHFEMSFRNERILVEAGTSSYYDPIRRPYERSSAGHNTVEIDGQSQSTNWGNFRVARRGHCKLLKASRNGTEGYLIGEHDGFLYKAGILHRRRISCLSGSITVQDTFISSQTPVQNIYSYLHFSQACDLKLIGKHTLLVATPHGTEIIIKVDGAECRVEQMNYSERYNELKMGKLLVMRIEQSAGSAIFTIEKMGNDEQ